MADIRSHSVFLLSCNLVVVYNGIENPIYKTGENDRGEGLKELAQKGDASGLKAYGVDAEQKGDISASVGLFDNDTAVDQFPGAGITQFNLAGTPLQKAKL